MKNDATSATEPYEQILTIVTLNPHIKSIDLRGADLLLARASEIALELSQVGTTISDLSCYKVALFIPKCSCCLLCRAHKNQIVQSLRGVSPSSRGPACGMRSFYNINPLAHTMMTLLDLSWSRVQIL